jgi:uncharacterized protein YdhG (YjbR/CyaY superfamily)
MDLNKISTVDEYLAELSQDEKDALQRIRSIISSTIPESQERIAYKICVFSVKKDLVGFAAQKDFLSFYTMSPDLVKKMKEDLQNFQLSGATIHFTLQNPLPKSLIEKILLARLKENLQKRR